VVVAAGSFVSGFLECEEFLELESGGEWRLEDQVVVCECCPILVWGWIGLHVALMISVGRGQWCREGNIWCMLFQWPSKDSRPSVRCQ
jgi:hypothetical protein